VNKGFLKINRGLDAQDLLEGDPKAFLMLTWIALRASRETGEALIGDWRRMGATSEAAYRRTKKRLEATGLATFQATTRGTIATLVDTRVYNINRVKADDQSDDQSDEQTPKKATSKPTTNKNLKESFIKELKEYGVSGSDTREWLMIRTHRRNTPGALKTQAKNFKRMVDEGFDPQKIMRALIDNTWIGIKPNERYFRKAIGGEDNVKSRIEDVSWASPCDQHAVRDVLPSLRDMDESQDGRGDQKGEKAMAISSAKI